MGYGPWFGPPEAGEVNLLPGHNSSYKRDLLLDYGDRLESLLAAETSLQQDLRARGFRLYLEPAAKAFHTNFTEPSRWIPYLFYSGRVFAAERGRDWPRLRRAGYGAGSCLIPLVRLVRLAPRFRRARPDLAVGVYGPLLFALIVDAAGPGSRLPSLGAGRAAEKVARLEFHRHASSSAVMASRQPFFSVIIPTYSHPAELPGCLEALARQQFPIDSFEVIVVDDGSALPPVATVQGFENRLAVRLVAARHGGPGRGTQLWCPTGGRPILGLYRRRLPSRSGMAIGARGAFCDCAGLHHRGTDDKRARDESLRCNQPAYPRCRLPPFQSHGCWRGAVPCL